MKDIVENYCKIRDYLEIHTPQKIKIFLTDSWNPIVKNSLIKSVMDLIENELLEKFPDFPEIYLPRCRFRINEEEDSVEVGIQQYLNHEPESTFLGSVCLGNELFDCYIRSSYDPRFNYIFTSRYGHGKDDYYSGSKTAEAEYYLGQYTPLSIAYAIAYEDGFIG